MGEGSGEVTPFDASGTPKKRIWRRENHTAIEAVAQMYCLSRGLGDEIAAVSCS